MNVVTVFAGPGLGCETEIEASRKLVDTEIDAVLDADAGVQTHDETTDRPSLPTQHRV